MLGDPLADGESGGVIISRADRKSMSAVWPTRHDPSEPRPAEACPDELRQTECWDPGRRLPARLPAGIQRWMRTDLRHA